MLSVLRMFYEAGIACECGGGQSLGWHWPWYKSYWALLSDCLPSFTSLCSHRRAYEISHSSVREASKKVGSVTSSD